MFVELRIYKRFDQNLLALKLLGVNLQDILRRVLYNYARGIVQYYAIVNDTVLESGDAKLIHLRVKISDPESQAVLQKVRSLWRNAFCKALIREAFVMQNMGIFFYDDVSPRALPDVIEPEIIGADKPARKQIVKRKASTATIPTTVQSLQKKEIKETFNINEEFNKLLF